MNILEVLGGSVLVIATIFLFFHSVVFLITGVALFFTWLVDRVDRFLSERK